MHIFDLKGATLLLKDGASTPNTLEVRIGEGNFTWEEKVNREYIKNRGVLDSVRNGDQEPVEVKFEFVWDFIKGDSSVTIEDFLKKANDASAYVSSDSDLCNPYAVDLQLTYIPPGCTSLKKETLLFADFRYESLSHDAKASQISCTGKCNIIAPTSARASQS